MAIDDFIEIGGVSDEPVDEGTGVIVVELGDDQEVIQFTQERYFPVETDGFVRLNVTRRNPTSQAIEIPFSITPDNAILGLNFLPPSVTSISFPLGIMAAFLDIIIPYSGMGYGQLRSLTVTLNPDPERYNLGFPSASVISISGTDFWAPIEPLLRQQDWHSVELVS